MSKHTGSPCTAYNTLNNETIHNPSNSNYSNFPTNGWVKAYTVVNNARSIQITHVITRHSTYLDPNYLWIAEPLLGWEVSLIQATCCSGQQN